MDRQEPATPLAAFRIAISAVVLWTLADMLRTGVLPAVWMRPAEGGILVPSEDQWLISALGGASPRVVIGLTVSAVLSAAALLTGIFSRASALVLLQCLLALFSLNRPSGGGHDQLLANALWLLVLAPSDATLSLRSRLQHGRWRSGAKVAAWPRVLIIYQLVLMYTCTGAQKLGAVWWPSGDFSAIYRALLLPHWTRADLSWVARVYPLTQAMTAAVVPWEFTWWVVLIALWFRHTRTRPGRLRAASNRLNIRGLYALIGIAVHLGIAATMNLGPFSAVTLSFYLCLWHGDEYPRCLKA